MKSTIYWIWLSLRLGQGNMELLPLISYFKSPENIYHEMDRNVFSRVLKGFRRSAVDFLLDKSLDESYKIEAYCKANKIDVLPFDSDRYPKALRQLSNPPIVLYARGQIRKLDEKLLISVVGTRSLTEYGRKTAYKIGYELAAAGVVVVSGLARGIDSAAACGALDAGGKTIAVLGSGLDRMYPPEHKKLAQQISRNGIVISEYPPLTSPDKPHFPLRNRIISGLSIGTAVVEADMKSGALITARDTVMQGRDLFSIPGNIDEKNSQGTNDLIKQGATAITCAADMLEFYKITHKGSIDLRALSKARSKSDLKAGALAARGVDEGIDLPLETFENEENESQGSIANALHEKKRLDGELVKALSGETEFPVYDNADVKIVKNNAQDSKVSDKAESDAISKALAGLDGRYVKIFESMPIGEPVSIDNMCSKGFDVSTVVTAFTMLELNGLIISLPAGRYCRK